MRAPPWWQRPHLKTISFLLSLFLTNLSILLQIYHLLSQFYMCEFLHNRSFLILIWISSLAS